MNKYPIAFIERMKAQLGNEFEEFLVAIEQPPITSIRCHPSKYNAAVSSLPIADKIPWADLGFYLNERPSFTFDPLFHAGAYYVQESSSMFLEQAIKAIPNNAEPLKVLDLCAAPGGKTTHLLSLMHPNSLVIANEILSQRNAALRQNLARWGYNNAVITQNQSADFKKLGEFFDVILLDAPCSGEGLFRRDKNAITEWSEANVTMCAERQRDIISNTIQCLKPGGYLIYSTCTYAEVENLDNINYLLDTHEFESIEIPTAHLYDDIVTTLRKDNAVGYAFYPHRTMGEGFFISLLRKKGSTHHANPHSIPLLTKDKTTTELLTHMADYMLDSDNYVALKHATFYHLLPSHLFQDYKWLAQNLYVKGAGIDAGELKGYNFVPAHALCLSTAMRPDFPSIDVDKTQAIQYLKAETIAIPTSHMGWVAVRYMGANLGFAKALSNRINNYFPKNWRILKAQT